MNQQTFDTILKARINEGSKTAEKILSSMTEDKYLEFFNNTKVTLE